MAFTPVCTPCLAGTYSLEGSHHCELCTMNTFSQKGSSFCKKCLQTEYSGYFFLNFVLYLYFEIFLGIKAKTCLKRPTCDSFDFYNIRDSQCIKNGTKQILRYKCVQPNICLTKTQNVKNVCDGFVEESCLPCRIGMARNVDTGFCEYCKDGEYSNNGIGCIKLKKLKQLFLECKKCAENTLPDYGLYFNKWDYIPEEIKTTCEYLFAG